MKRIHASSSFPLLLLFLIPLSATFPFHGTKQSKARITGRISEPTGNTLQIDDKTIDVSEDGRFQLSSDVTRPSFHTIHYGNAHIPLYLEPGTSIDVSFNAKNTSSSLQFKGEFEKIDVFLQTKPAVDRSVDDYLDAHYLVGGWRNPKLDPPAKCLTLIDSMKKLYLEPLNGLLKGPESISKPFVSLYRADIHLTLNLQLLRYLDYLGFSGNQNFLLVSSVPEITEYLSRTDIDDPMLLDLQSYKRYCGYLLYLKVSEELQKNPSIYTSDHRWLDAMLNVVPRLFSNQHVRDYWLYNETKYYIDNDGIKNIEKNLEQFNELCKTKEFRENIKTSYDNEVQRQKDHLVRTYKTVTGYRLEAHIFVPKGLKPDELLPAMVIFHGGSWYEGKPDWEFGYADRLVNVCIEYRTRYRHGANVFEEVSDAKSAIRWLRSHGEEFHIDPHKIVATGFSAGAHLALCTAMVDALDEPEENGAISSRPDALVLNSAGYDTTIYFTESQEDAISKISPIHLVRKNLPPMLIFHGTKDTDTPYKCAIDFVRKMSAKGNVVRIQPIEDSGHAIWASDNYRKVYGRVRSKFFKETGIQ